MNDTETITFKGGPMDGKTHILDGSADWINVAETLPAGLRHAQPPLRSYHYVRSVDDPLIFVYQP